MFLIMVLLLPQFQHPTNGYTRPAQKDEITWYPPEPEADKPDSDHNKEDETAFIQTGTVWSEPSSDKSDVDNSDALSTGRHLTTAKLVTVDEEIPENNDIKKTVKSQSDKELRALDVIEDEFYLELVTEGSVQKLTKDQFKSVRQIQRTGAGHIKTNNFLYRSGTLSEKNGAHIFNIARLIDKYNSKCGHGHEKHDAFCDRVLLQLHVGMKNKRRLTHRKPRNILDPSFLCLKIIPLKIDWYNPLTNICCNGVHERVTGNEICCGTDVINETEIVGCCGKDAYNKNVSVCCSNILHHGSNSSYHCCGPEVYNIFSTLGCCGGQIYDSREQFCCDDEVFRRYNHSSCCGTEIYDSRCYSCNETTIPHVYPTFRPSSQVCCQGRIKTIKQNKTVCCGKRLMDSNIDECVNDTLVHRPARRKQDIHSNITLVTRKTLKTLVAQFEGADNSTVEADTKESLKNNTLVGVSGLEHETLNTEETPFERDTSTDTSDYLIKIITVTVAFGLGALIAVALVTRKLILYLKRSGEASQVTEPFLNNLSEANVSLSNENKLLEPIDDCIPSKLFSADDVDEATFVSPSLTAKSAFLNKSLRNDTKNLTSELSNDAETQTCGPKRSNVRDMFGKTYQYNCYLDKFNRTLAWKNSDCKMTLPETAFEQHTIEAYASSFDDIPSIYEKFSIPIQTRLVSPVVEYRLPGVKTLKDFALVELPFIGNQEHIEVWKCPSDEGMYQTVERLKVPVLEHCQTNADLFCHIEDGKVRVYTRSFSIFFCTCEEQPRNLCLQAFLFGSYKKILERKEVRLSLYIADELHKFEDYKQRMYEKERRQERDLKCEQEIILHKEMKSEDFLITSMEMTGSDKEFWAHKRHPSSDRVLEEVHKKVDFSELVRCCNSSRSLPYQARWYMENKPNTRPEEVIQCIVDIVCHSVDSESEPLHTILVVDELYLRAKDREKVPSEQDRAADLKDYLVHHLPEERKNLLNEQLKMRNKLSRGSSHCEDLTRSLDLLYHDMMPAAFTQTVTYVLDDMHFDDTINELLERKYISKAHLNRPFQACSRENNSVQETKNTCKAPDLVFDPAGDKNFSESPSPDCRRELNESIISSFDNRNAGVQEEREEIFIPNGQEDTRPSEESGGETELKQIVTSI